MRKRIFAVAMSLIMAISLLPVSAFAAGEVTAGTYAETLEQLGYTFTLSGVHIPEAGYYKLDGTKVDSEEDADVQVTDAVNKKMKYLNGNNWDDVAKVFELEHTAWEKEAVGVYIGGEKITESGSNNGISVDLENKKITLNGATINHTTGEMTYFADVDDPDYPQWYSRTDGVYNNITGVPGVLVIKEGTYNDGHNGPGASNWDSYYYWMGGYNTDYQFGSIALGIMVDDKSGAAMEDWTLELIGENTITVTNEFAVPARTQVNGRDYWHDAAAYGVFAESNLKITGTGSLATNVNNEWNILEAYNQYPDTNTAGAIYAKGNLEIVSGSITASTSTQTADNGMFNTTLMNPAGAIGSAGSVTITGENTSVTATDTTTQGSAIRGTTGVTITDSATVTAESSSDLAGAAIMAGTSQWSGAPVEISNGANVTTKAASTSDNEQLASGTGIVGSTVEVKGENTKLDVDAQATGVTAGKVTISEGNVTVDVEHEDGTAIDADSAEISVGSYSTPLDSDFIADGSVVADGAVVPKDELTDYSACIGNTYYTGEDGGNKAIADLENKQTVWLNVDTTASRDDFGLGNTVTIMLAEGKTFTGTIYGPGVKADIVEGNQEEMDGVLYTEYIYTMVVNSEDAGAKVIHADGTETYYKDLFGSEGAIYVLNKLADGDTVIALKDAVCDYYAGYDLTKDVTLDLNGKTLTFEDSGGLNVKGKANDTVTVTIIDSSEEKTGKIVNTYTTSSNYVGTTVVARDYAEVIIEGGTYDGKTYSLGGELTLAGGTYLREVVAGNDGTTIVTENADITGCEAYADGGVLILSGQTIGGDVSETENDSVTWKIVDASGNDADYEDIEAGNCKLIISGTGNMKSFSREDAPWISYDSIISEVVIEDGVTNISDSAFEDMNGYDLTLGNSITTIHGYAFDYCDNLGKITISENMTVSLNALNGYNPCTVEGFVVAEGNAVYSTDGKALYYSGDVEGKKLMKAVATIEGNYEIDDKIVDIKARAFDNVLFDSVTIPASFDNVYTFRKPAEVPEGMTFSGYYTSNDPTVVEELRIDTTGVENKEAFTVYMVLGYEVTYDFGSSEETVVVPANKMIKDFAPAVSVDGKTLIGWSTTENGTEADASDVAPTEAMTVYAVWETDESFTPDYSEITVADLVAIPDQTYTGEAIEPAVLYTKGGVTKQFAESAVTYAENVNAGTATVTIQTGEGNTPITTTFKINPAEFNPSDYSWAVGTKTTSYSAAVDYTGDIYSMIVKDLPEGITVTYTYDSTQMEGVKDVKYYSSGGVASYSVKATFDLGENYVFESGLSNYSKTKSGSLTINPLEVTITADNKEMFVGEERPEFTYTVEGLEEGMSITTAPILESSASGNKAGSFPITVSGAVVNDDANNYKITYVEGYLTVKMKIMDAVVSFESDTVTYDGENHMIEVEVEGTLPDSFSVAYTVGGETFTGATDAGTYEVTATFTCSDPAYPAIDPMTATLKIEKAVATITADDQSMYVGGTMPALTYTVDGLVNGDELTDEPDLSCDADVNTIGTYEIVVTGGDAGDNYELNYENGTLSVTRVPSSGSSKPKYSASVDTDSMEDGSVKLSSTKAKAGSTVTITVTPDEGYELDELKVLDKDGNEVELTDKGNGKFTFKMPKGGVEIEASFEEIDEDEPAEDEPSVDEKEEQTLVLTINQLIYQMNGSYEVNDVAPIIKGDRTMLPIRLIAEFLGATVTWSEEEQSVTIVKDDTTIVIYIGQPFALVNGEPVQLDEAAFIMNDRTYLPLRFIVENLGATVTWDGVNQAVTIIG